MTEKCQVLLRSGASGKVIYPSCFAWLGRRPHASLLISRFLNNTQGLYKLIASCRVRGRCCKTAAQIRASPPQRTHTHTRTQTSTTPAVTVIKSHILQETMKVFLFCFCCHFVPQMFKNTRLRGTELLFKSITSTVGTSPIHWS